MRLIDADKWIKRLNRIVQDENSSKSEKDYAIFLISEISTYLNVHGADYDVDKVNEQLDDLNIYFDNDYYSSNNEAMLIKKDVKKIVKLGGVDGTSNN